jgi:hypothetical protein
MYWESLFTVNAMSGLMMERYWRAPTVLRYRVVLEKGSPSNRERLVEKAIGVFTGLASTILVWERMLAMYLY